MNKSMPVILKLEVHSAGLAYYLQSHWHIYQHTRIELLCKYLLHRLL